MSVQEPSGYMPSMEEAPCRWLPERSIVSRAMFTNGPHDPNGMSIFQTDNFASARCGPGEWINGTHLSARTRF